MMRLRVLSLLTLVVAVLVFLYSRAAFLALVIPAGNPVILWGLVLVILMGVSAVSVVSSVVLIFLSFFAIKPEADGSFVVDEDSFYGFAFMWVAKMDYSGQTKSFCKVFWQTNITLSAVSVVLGIATLVFFYILPYLYSLGIATIWNFMKHPLLILLLTVAGIAVVIVFCVAITIASKALTDTQFGGGTLGNFYHRYLCPKIRIK